MLAATAVKRETLNIRIKPEVRSLIDRAAKARGKSRTDFILDAARLAAEEALLDQVVITVSPQAYEQFLARLDMPPKPMIACVKPYRRPRPGSVDERCSTGAPDRSSPHRGLCL